jgi:hypothetical protein
VLRCELLAARNLDPLGIVGLDAEMRATAARLWEPSPAARELVSLVKTYVTAGGAP